jgi:chaperone modulatory protein CbpM
MTSMDAIFLEFHSLRQEDLENWIAQNWVRPEKLAGAYRFEDIDVARIRLIIELRDTLDVDERALPTVLSLLDQIYDLRRRMSALNTAMAQTLNEDIRAALRHRLEG